MDQYAAIFEFVQALCGAGVRDVCISPGSRSTPLALCFYALSGVRRFLLLDERGAAFFGLGLAKATGRPVAIVCTSGTAAANFHPAVVEAYHAHVPLVVLTADRPREARDVGAAQTIDQTRLFGSHAKWFAELPSDLGSEEELRYALALGRRAATLAATPNAGPVHVNVPLREPLLPEKPLQPKVPATGDLRGLPPRRTPPGEAVLAAADLLSGVERGLIVAGPLPGGEAPREGIALARRLGFPILADPLSGLRFGLREPQHRSVGAYDLFLRDAGLRDSLQPDVVVRLGGSPTSKSLNLLLQAVAPGHTVLVPGAEEWRDPLLTPGITLFGDMDLALGKLLEALPPRGPGLFADRWRAADHAAQEAAGAWLDGLREPFDGLAVRSLARRLAPSDLLFVGSGMPVRDLDSFCAGPDGPRVLANRGANGIDGVVSSALGAAAAGPGRAALAIGDLSFYHDQSGLLAAGKFGLDLTILLLHNDGGGIFSFLPQAKLPEFEELFGTPHGLDFAPLVQMYGGTFVRPPDRSALEAALDGALATPGLHVVELRSDRTRNRELHAEVFARAQRAAREALRDA